MNSIQKNKFCVVLINFLLASLLIFAFSAQSAMAADESPTVQNQVSDVDSGTIFTRFITYVKTYISRNSSDDELVKEEKPVEKKVAVKETNETKPIKKEVKKAKPVEKKVAVKEIKKVKPVEKKVVVKEIKKAKPIKKEQPAEKKVAVKEVKKAKPIKKEVRNSEPVEEIDGPPEQEFEELSHREWHRKGQLKSETLYNKYQELHGLKREWYENGDLSEEANYKNGERDGLQRSWHSNGQLEEEETYVNEEKEGLSRTWHSNGQLETRATYRDGDEYGLAEAWDENGDLVFSENFGGEEKIKGPHINYENDDVKNDYLEAVSFLDADARKIYNLNTYNLSAGTDLLGFNIVSLNREVVAIIINGVLEGEEDGIAKTYYENQQLKSERTYKGRRLSGSEKIWNEEGQLISEGGYVKGVREGLHRSWHGNEQLKSEIIFKNGLRFGLHQSWHSNGQLKFETNYDESGNEQGLYQKWSKDGQLKYKAILKDGNEVEERIFYKSGKLKAMTTAEKGRTCWYENGEIDADCSSN